jgi:hypothetical protein
MKQPYNAKKPNTGKIKPEEKNIYMEHDMEHDIDEAPLLRHLPGFLPPNVCDETQGPGIRSLQNYKK